MSDSSFNFQQVANKLQTLVPDADAILESERSLYEQYLEWETLADRKIPEVKLRDIFKPEIETQSIILQNFLGKWGNLSIEAVAKLCLICRWVKPKVIFEIGTYTGMTTLQMAMNTRKCSIYTLDLPLTSETINPLSQLDKQVSTHFNGKLGTQTGCYFKDQLGLYDIRQLWGDSATFNFEPFHKKVDLVFIDAAHDYENKKSDTINAFKMLAPNGVIIWDNYKDPVNPYCTKFLGELNLPLYWLKGTNLVIFKHENSNPS